MQRTTHFLLILSALFSITFAYPANSPGHPELNDPNADLHSAETIWDIFNQGGRGYSGWGTAGVQPSPVAANRVLANYPTAGYASYPQYPQYANYPNTYYPKYPLAPVEQVAPTVYSGYANQFPTYENYAIHGGHGFGKYGKY